MSEYPEAQRVRRADLASFPSPEVSSPLQGLDARFQSQLAEIYGSVVSEALNEEQLPTRHDAELAIDGAEDNTADAYSFRLFSNPSATGTKIVVRSPTSADRESGFVQLRRPDSYYFTGCLGRELKEQYRYAAISGQRILDGSNIRWPGCELPWRVFSIRSTDAPQALGGPTSKETDCQKKRRIGKKRRIAIRKSLTVAKELKMRAQRNEAEKEAAEKEKRTRRNREKKIKRKQKEKVKKVQISEKPD